MISQLIDLFIHLQYSYNNILIIHTVVSQMFLLNTENEYLWSFWSNLKTSPEPLISNGNNH